MVGPSRATQMPGWPVGLYGLRRCCQSQRRRLASAASAPCVRRYSVSTPRRSSGRKRSISDMRGRRTGAASILVETNDGNLSWGGRPRRKMRGPPSGRPVRMLLLVLRRWLAVLRRHRRDLAGTRRTWQRRERIRRACDLAGHLHGRWRTLLHLRLRQRDERRCLAHGRRADHGLVTAHRLPGHAVGLLERPLASDLLRAAQGIHFLALVLF